MKNYKIICRETGDVIDSGLNASEALADLKRYEKLDKENNVYTPDFYEIVEEERMTTEEKNELLNEANYLQGLVNAFLEASYICSLESEKEQMIAHANDQLEKLIAIQSKIKD